MSVLASFIRRASLTLRVLALSSTSDGIEFLSSLNLSSLSRAWYPKRRDATVAPESTAVASSWNRGLARVSEMKVDMIITFPERQ